MKTKLIPFDINKAQAGAKVVTRDGRIVKRLYYCFDCDGDSHPIKAYVQEEDGITTYGFTKSGTFNIHEEIESPHDLFIEKEVKQRLMTKQELSKWLREHPEEFREYKQFGYIASEFTYYISEADIPVNDDILIRRNYGKWEEPLIEE